MANFYDVFISYGRPDSKEFVKQLAEELTAIGLKVWLDLSDIPPAVDWQEQINDGILRAHNFIFVISPHAVNSEYCRQEVNLAVEYHKRLIPLLHVQEITQETWQQRNPKSPITDWEAEQKLGKHSIYPNIHPELGRINWIYCRENQENFQDSLTKLLQVIRVDADYVQQHTEILVKAVEWVKNRQQTNYLLIGEDRVKAESWLTVKFDNQPPVIPNNLQAEYICESTKNANNLMTQVFISHVVEDQEIKETIERSLMRQGITIWRNKIDIQSGVDFQEEINRGIEGADNFIYLISPLSLLSKYCQMEISIAFKYNKRIIPLLIKPTNLEEIPPELRHLQFIDVTASLENFHQGIAQLINEIKTDAAYYLEHKVLLVKALKWQRQNNNPSILLRGYNLQYYQNWLKIARTKEQPALALHEEFIQASSGQQTEQILDVFISYSRSDSDLARRINEELQLLGKTTWFDQESIATGVNFQQEILHGIETCDNFVFIISPKSINSPYCADEVEHAFMLNKRFITILCQEVKTQDLHPALATVQWIDFRHHGGDFYANFSQLMRTIDTDRDHVRNHTKWLSRALDWEQAGKTKDLLLRGSEESNARDWLNSATHKDKQPFPSDLHREFITKSREALIAQKKQEKRQLLILRSLLVGVSLALLFAIGVSWFAIRQKNEAERQATVATVRDQAAQVLDFLPVEPVQGLVLAIATTFNSEKRLKEVLPEAQSSLYEAVEVARESFLLQGYEGSVTSVAWSPNGQNLASASDDNTVRLWSPEGKSLVTLTGHTEKVTSVAWSPDGKYLASGSQDKTVRLWSPSGKSLATLIGHSHSVYSLAWSPDGKYLASASTDNTVRLWSPEGKSLATLTGHEDGVYSLAWSPDGKYLASGSGDKTVRLWSPEGKSLATLTGHSAAVFSVAWSPDGKYLASGSVDNTVRLWSPEGKSLATLTGHSNAVWSVAWSPDGQNLASGSNDKTVRLWSPEGESLAILTGHENGVWSVGWSPDGKYLASASDDKTVRLWSSEGKSLIGHSDSVYSLAWSPDGKYLASASRDKTVRLWSSEGNSLATLTGASGAVMSVGWSPDGKYLASGSNDKTVRLWSPEGKSLATLIGHSESVISVGWSPDGKYLASGSNDKTVRLWSLEGKSLATLTGHSAPITSLAWSPDGKYLATGSRDKTVRLWSPEGKSLATLTGHSGTVTSVAWSLDGKYLASGSRDKTVRLWSPEGKSLATLTGHSAGLTSLAWSPDGQSLASASASDDATVRLWSPSGKFLATLTGHSAGVNSLAWSADGQYLASASWDNTVRLWSPEGKSLATLTGHKGSVNYLAWSADGQYLASASWDNTVRMWSPEGKSLATLTGHKGSVKSLAWSPDGKYLASGSQDKTVRLWTLGWQSWFKTACSRLRLHPALLNPETDKAKTAVEGCLEYGGWSEQEKTEFYERKKAFSLS